MKSIKAQTFETVKLVSLQFTGKSIRQCVWLEQFFTFGSSLHMLKCSYAQMLHMLKYYVIIVIIMHLSMKSRRGVTQGMGWGFDYLCWPYLNLSLPDMGPTWGWIWLPTRTKETETEHMFPHFHASRTRRKVWKDLEIMEANENKPKVSGFYCIDQLNLLRYCGIKVNGSKEKPSRFLQVQLISAWLTFATITI